MKLTTTLLGASLLISTSAMAVPVSFTKLTGITGGTLAGTAVYRADLSSIGISDIASITIADNSGGLGGSPGQFSGFDLDAIILSTTNCADASCAAGLSGISVFNYTSAGTVFAPGSQRVPTDPKLFGTDATGSAIDNLVATLGVFDGESTTAIPGADGFLSMGDNGILSFNLTSLLSTAGLYLYIGEVGDNGEVANAGITVSQTPVPVPGAAWLLGLGLAGLIASRKSKTQSV